MTVNQVTVNQVKLHDRDFECDVHSDERSNVVVALRGELDADGLQDAEAALQRGMSLATGDLSVDVSGLSFISAAGLGALAVLADRLGQRGDQLRLVGSSPLLVRLLDVTELTRCVVLEPAADAAGSAPGR